MYSDNETVDVASSDETEEDDDNDVNEDPGEEQRNLAEKPRSPSLSDILHLGHNNLDFLSEIYNTAFSKVPKVIKIISLSINLCLCEQFKLIRAFKLFAQLCRCMQVTQTASTLTTAGPGTTAVWTWAQLRAAAISTGIRPSETQRE